MSFQVFKRGVMTDYAKNSHVIFGLRASDHLRQRCPIQL